MSGASRLVIFSVLFFALHVQSRPLQTAQIPAAAEPECVPSWSAQLDITLANTLRTGVIGRGRASFTLIDEDTLYFRVEAPEGSRIKGVELQTSPTVGTANALDLPITTQWQSSVEGSVESNTTAFESALAVLRGGRAVITVKAADSEPALLIGALRNDCQPRMLQASISSLVAKPSAPACLVPGFMEVYHVPSTCGDFAERVERVCEVKLEDVLAASALNAQGRPVGHSLSTTACLPKGCDPCAAAPATEAGSVEEDWSEAVASMAGACRRPGFESFYEVPSHCDNVGDRLQDFCGVSLPDVMQATALSQVLPSAGICVPSGCDPCAPYPSEEETEAALDAAPPTCENSYLFGKAYSIPVGCSDFTDALRTHCGVEAEAVAEASGFQSFPALGGFGPGKTVCLPAACEPCSAAQQTAAAFSS